MSGIGMVAAERDLPRLVAEVGGAWDSSGHRHGRWSGIFKLNEEAGELAAACASALAFEDINFCVSDNVVAAAEALLADIAAEIADVGAAAIHVQAANGLQLARIEARAARMAPAPKDARAALTTIVLRCGQITQLLGKISAFPHGTEHPDGKGNLPGRLECAIADLLSAAMAGADMLRLDLPVIHARTEAKLALFRRWFLSDRGAS